MKAFADCLGYRSWSISQGRRHSEPTERAGTFPCIPSSRDPSHTEGGVWRAPPFRQLAPLCFTVLLAAPLRKTHCTKCGTTIKQACSQGQSNTVSIVSFDYEVFPAQTIGIYNMLKPKPLNKNEVWINKLWRKPKRTFDFLPFLISWQLTSFWAGGGCLTHRDCPAQGGLKKGAEGRYR